MFTRARLHFGPTRWSLAVGITAASFLLPAASTSLTATELPSGATLTILADPVQVAPFGAADFADALSGQSLAPGDVVRTGDTGVALLTFFDGSESQLSAGSQVQIEQADYTPAPQIALFQSSGVSVNRVIPLPPGGSFRTDTPDATGLVRGTSYVVTVADDQEAVGTAMTLLTDLDGHVGHVQVVPPVASTSDLSVPIPTQATVDLIHPGDLGSASVAATDASQPTASHIDDATLVALEQAAHNLHNADSARTASNQARQTLRNVAPAPLAVSRLGAGAPKTDPTTSSNNDARTPKVDMSTPPRADALPDPTRPSAPAAPDPTDPPAPTSKPSAPVTPPNSAPAVPHAPPSNESAPPSSGSAPSTAIPPSRPAPSAPATPPSPARPAVSLPPSNHDAPPPRAPIAAESDRHPASNSQGSQG